jgi:hypothetical protein
MAEIICESLYHNPWGDDKCIFIFVHVQHAFERLENNLLAAEKSHSVTIVVDSGFVPKPVARGWPIDNIPVSSNGRMSLEISNVLQIHHCMPSFL